MKRKIILTVLLTQIIGASGAQELPDHGNIALRFAAGFSTIKDDAIKDRFTYKPCYAFSFYPIIKMRKFADMICAFSFENKGAYNNQTSKRMEMNYAALLLAPSFHYPSVNSRFMAGIYSG